MTRIREVKGKGFIMDQSEYSISASEKAASTDIAGPQAITSHDSKHQFRIDLDHFIKEFEAFILQLNKTILACGEDEVPVQAALDVGGNSKYNDIENVLEQIKSDLFCNQADTIEITVHFETTQNVPIPLVNYARKEGATV